MPEPVTASEQAKPPAAIPEEPKLSPAELKKKAKAEKQARRAVQKEQQGPPDTRPKGGQQKSQQPQQKQNKQASLDSKHHERPGSSQQSLPLRRRPSQSDATKEREQPKKGSKQVELFSHLYTQPRRHTIEGASKDIHPAVLALGFQMSSYEICGSSARCVAMLLAFKESIQAYTTPNNWALSRHLNSHYLSPQIDYLKSCRPISMSMGNAIRWLKNLIGKVDPNMPEQEAKDFLCGEIDRFVHERITISDQAIATTASAQIRKGAVLLTYGKSSIVEKTILQAYANGTEFRVVIVDARPLFEGKQLATSLMRAGIEVEYLPFSGITHAVKQASLVLLGAHAMLSNGRLQSRVGTASIALAAHEEHIPVIVCCESVKFSDRVTLDSIVMNEVAPSEELFLPARVEAHAENQASNQEISKGGDDANGGAVRSLRDWKDIAGLQILNLMYDVTPAEYIRMVICEYGSVPPSSVPVVHRLANEGM
ncbi:hypothetical protein BAUCODRAFT_67383 [Baudoinia panamericana UAMH 10762]|uniref:Translation initiation factor eIF2B subunit delta n=1 Tax=Baudoinia panamericana (strain UAMH 10762) TaxID=717646 RepID=M2NFM3_BAUPA|nr:uncharacterized protein BAUCODRAFT_67383 [Baudoinia panamericana UAMH 10762]EMC97805.1 hypothetical protein BAUCODRAFT_67383 [Baudoinia panamericana UAMH 10762]